MAYPEDFYQKRSQEVRESFVRAVNEGSTSVEKVTAFRDDMQAGNEGVVTPTLAGINEALTVLQSQQ